MKKIIIIDGGPRKTFNTAAMLQKVAEGAASAGEDVEVKTVRLYDMEYKGCVSCMACKLAGRVSHVCRFRDGLTPEGSPRRPSAPTATATGSMTSSRPTMPVGVWPPACSRHFRFYSGRVFAPLFNRRMLSVPTMMMPAAMAMVTLRAANPVVAASERWLLTRW